MKTTILTLLFAGTVLCDKPFLYSIVDKAVSRVSHLLGDGPYPDYYGNLNFTATYDPSLPGPTCIKGGYLFCQNGLESLIRKDEDRVLTICCKNA